MGYVFKGSLCGVLCPDFKEPLAKVRVRLYRVTRPNVTTLAVANPNETFVVLTDETVRAKAGFLLAETDTDTEGRFAFQLDDKYAGEAFEIDVLCTTVPNRKAGGTPQPLQFSITTLQPLWRQSEAGFLAGWEYCVPTRFWCAVRARFDAWTICGRLLTCNGRAPIPGATVQAFDVDWLQDDPLGSAVTDATGRFRIDYLTSDFQLTPFSPVINWEWLAGPDVYFSAALGGQEILAEPRSAGRLAGRENVGHCFCVEVCSDKVQPPAPDKLPHWQSVADFDIHPFPPDPASSFSVEGYAGGAGASYVFGGGIPLRGNCPLRNVAAPANALEYRFLIGEWSAPAPGDGDPTMLPTVPPVSLLPITQVLPTNVGYVFYINALGQADSAPVHISSPIDVNPDGWVRIDGKAVTVDMRNGSSSTVLINESNFLRTFELEILNSAAISAAHVVRLPLGLPHIDAGRELTTAEQEPVRRYRLQFQVRDAVTQAAPLYIETLAALVIDNRSVVVALDLEELRVNACNPLAGNAAVHLLYTVDHPSLRSFSVQISNNTGIIHGAPPLPSATFAAPPPTSNYLFRGGAGGPHLSNGLGGIPVDITQDGPCAYAVSLSWQTRHYQSSPASLQILYCK